MYTISGSNEFLTSQKRQLGVTKTYTTVESVLEAFRERAPKTTKYTRKRGDKEYVVAFEEPGALTHLTLYCDVGVDEYPKFYRELLFRMSQFQVTTTLECAAVIFTLAPVMGVGREQRWRV